MKWFQHDSNASHDAKVKKLIIRHGAEGYAVYFHCLELIAGDLTQTNVTFELEHDSEIIADNLKITGNSNESGIDRVNRILKDIIDLGLFEQSDNRVFCYKMAMRLDNTISRNAEVNKIKLLRSENEVKTLTYKAEEKTVHNNTTDKNIEDDSFKEFWSIYDYKVGKPKSLKKWNTLSQKDKDSIFDSLNAYIKSTPDKQFRKQPMTYLNQRSWEDEIIIKSNKPPFKRQHDNIFIANNIPIEYYDSLYVLIRDKKLFVDHQFSMNWKRALKLAGLYNE